MEKIIKRISLVLATLFMINSTLFAADSSVSGDSLYAEDKLRKTSHYATSLDLNIKCRKLKDAKLRTQIVDFDIAKGITYCQIYKKDNPDFIFSTNADAQWLLKRDTEKENIERKNAITKVSSMTSNICKSTGSSSDGDTLSTFLIKTVLLMDNSAAQRGRM